MPVDINAAPVEENSEEVEMADADVIKDEDIDSLKRKSAEEEAAKLRESLSQEERINQFMMMLREREVRTYISI